MSAIGENILDSNILSTCPHNMANFGSLTAEIVSEVWGTPANFNGFRVLASLLQRYRSPEAILCTMFGRLLGSYTIHFRGFLPEFCPCAKFTLRSSLAFSYIASVTARHSSSGRHPNFAAWYKEENYGTFTDGATYIRLGGRHVGYRPF